jgi:hypothetical protein
MKCLAFIIGLLISVSVLAQQTEIPYVFPIRPGTEEWKKLSSSDAMDSVCVIPELTLKNLPTKSLLITCLNYPRLVDFFLSDNLQTAFNFYSKHFLGLNTLMNRSDINSVLLNAYFDTDINQKKLADYSTNLTFGQIAVFELIISQESLINNYSKTDKDRLLKEAIRKLEQRQQNGDSIFEQTTTALIISRLLKSENLLGQRIDNYGRDILKIFNSTATLFDPSIINYLLTTAKEIAIL